MWQKKSEKGPTRRKKREAKIIRRTKERIMPAHTHSSRIRTHSAEHTFDGLASARNPYHFSLHRTSTKSTLVLACHGAHIRALVRPASTRGTNNSDITNIAAQVAKSDMCRYFCLEQAKVVCARVRRTNWVTGGRRRRACLRSKWSLVSFVGHKSGVGWGVCVGDDDTTSAHSHEIYTQKWLCLTIEVAFVLCLSLSKHTSQKELLHRTHTRSESSLAKKAAGQT